MAEHPKKRQAYLLFVEQAMEAKQIAELLGVSENTISKWNRAEGWKELRNARMLSPDKLIQLYYEQSEEIIIHAKQANRPINTGEADALNKLAAAIQRLDKKVDPSITMSVLRNYNNYVIQINPELAKQNVEYELSYVQTLLDAQK